MISFSTCWNSHRHTEGEEMIDEIIALGFDTVEVSHGMKISLLPGVQEAFKKGKMKVSGVHNFCPSPVELMLDAPDAYEFSSDRAYDRDRCYKLTQRSIEMAAEFESEYVVLHMGSVRMKNYRRELEALAKENRVHSRDYVKLKLKSVEARAKAAPLYFERSQEALAGLTEDAEKYGIKLAVESRSSYEDIPSENEMTLLMEEFADNPWVGYWHDFGHVQRKENLGYLDHFEWLKSMQPYLIGCHLHDVRYPARDHRVPLTTGGVDCPNLMPLVSPDMPVVWELSPRRRSEQIVESLALWNEQYGY